MGRVGQGFTLIEVTIVVAIVGILAAFSIPVYQGYVVQTQVNRAASELARYRAPVEEVIGSSSPLTNDAIGYVPSKMTTGNLATNVAAFNPDGSGHLQVTLGGNAHPKVSGVVITHQRSVDGRWECVIDNSANPGAWSDMYMPTGCRL